VGPALQRYAGDRGETRCLLLQCLKRVQDADDRAEQPTNGAVEPMVARAERPRFISACTMATERSRPAWRLQSLPRRNLLRADWNSESPVATPGVWLFLLRSRCDCFVEFSVLDAPATCSRTGATACARCCTSGSGQS